MAIATACHSIRAPRIAPAPYPSTASTASEDRDEAQRARMHMKGVLSFEMIRAGADALRDAGVPQHIANAVFEAIHNAAEPDIVGKPCKPQRKRVFTSLTANAK